MNSLEPRVRRLERELRIYRLAAFAALAGVLTMFLLGASEGTPDVIQAKRFEVVDRQGRALVTLKTTGHGGFVQTLGNDGISGVSIGAAATGGFVGVRDGRPTLFPRVELSTDESGGMLAVRNWNGFAIEIDRDGLSVAHTLEDTGFTRVDPRVVLGVSENGGHIRVMSASGEAAAIIAAEEDGTGVVSTFNRQGKKKVMRPER